jgi:Holliday junction resolvasome RuvABC DNA-binding subunit
LDKLAEDAFMELAVTVADNPFDWHIGRDQSKRKAAKQDVHTRGDAELKEVARVYRENVDSRPVEAVEALGYSRRTAARRIQQARLKGLLPPTTQGKRKA